jgi:hypothetical protein
MIEGFYTLRNNNNNTKGYKMLGKDMISIMLLPVQSQPLAPQDLAILHRETKTYLYEPIMHNYKTKIYYRIS